MRENKFRGRSLEDDKWVYGDLLQSCGQSYICSSYTILDEFIQAHAVEVDPETVGQYTGLKDKNCKKIYEGDIVSLNENTDLWSTLCGVVEFRRGSFISAYNWKGSSEKDERFDYLIDVVRNGFEIIGNIHSNPELLEVQNAE